VVLPPHGAYDPHVSVYPYLSFLPRARSTLLSPSTPFAPVASAATAPSRPPPRASAATAPSLPAITFPHAPRPLSAPSPQVPTRFGSHPRNHLPSHARVEAAITFIPHTPRPPSVPSPSFPTRASRPPSARFRKARYPQIPQLSLPQPSTRVN
jgi:hypothetical protein